MKTTVFRVDASVDIGTGHVMRCLTLADALHEKGFKSHFLCREHPGHLIGLIQAKGYETHVLPADRSNIVEAGTAHAAWLGTTRATDARVSCDLVKKLRPTWLIVDHYALDDSWERHMRGFCKNLMVIDDLADRNHVCDVLLDQNLGRSSADYIARVPAHCKILTGPHYALLRPEFAKLRSYSLQRRRHPALRNLLVSMGGVDRPNASCAVLSALREYALPENCKISVIIGATTPWLKQIYATASTVPYPVEILIDIRDMAKRMADCDLSIGAAGATSWERCCLGVPSIISILAENQKQAARNLEQAGAVSIANVLDDKKALAHALNKLFPFEKGLSCLSNSAASICDGKGVTRVGEIFEQ